MFPGFNKKNVRRSSIGGDFDRDGVKNRRDCQPLNWKKQDNICKKCGRNFTSKPSYEGYCPTCAKMEYLYSQGAITTESIKEHEKDWITKFK
jgi:predicted amidophosphoribosyltransferase